MSEFDDDILELDSICRVEVWLVLYFFSFIIIKHLWKEIALFISLILAIF